MAAPASFGSQFFNRIEGSATSNDVVALSSVLVVPAATVVGNLTFVPAKAVTSSVFYYFAPGEGAEDNDYFSITQKVGETPAKIDFKAASFNGVYRIRVAAEDTDGHVVERMFRIVAKSGPTGLVAGKPGMSVTAPLTQVGVIADAGGVLTSGPISDIVYELVTGTGDTNNALFEIDKATQKLLFIDPSAAGSYACRIKGTDKGGNTVTVGSVPVTVNAALTNMALSNAAVTAPATTVGNLSSTGGSAPLTYTLAAGTGDTNNDLFTITGVALAFGAASVAGSKSVRVKVTDINGTSYEKAFTITVS